MTVLPKVLIVEDDEYWMEIYQEFLQSVNNPPSFETVESYSLSQALQLLEKETFAVVLTDLRLLATEAGFSGFVVLERAKKIRSETQVIVITAYGTEKSAIEAIGKGAMDYIMKPVEPEKLGISIKNAVRVYEQYVSHRRVRDHVGGRNKARTQEAKSAIIGNSAGMRVVHKRVAEAAKTQDPLLIIGEPGTGKELVANFIHLNGMFPESPLARVDSTELMQLGEISTYPLNGGTFIVDNLQKLDASNALQAYELFQKCRKLNVRIIGISELARDLLVNRLESLELPVPISSYLEGIRTIILPPLRERLDGDDFATLVALFLHEMKTKRKTGLSITHAAITTLQQRTFSKGNIRELREFIEKVVERLPTNVTEIDKQHIPDDVPDILSTKRRVFVSYTSKHRQFVIDFINLLNHDAFDFWMDRDKIPYGVAWRRKIESALEDSDVMLFMLSPESRTSFEVGEELQYFRNLEKPIVIFEHEKCAPPLGLSTLQRIPYGLPIEEAARLVMEALRSAGKQDTSP